MSNETTKYLIATVAIPNTLSLEETAKQLKLSFQDVDFIEEKSGRFEEVPAFVATNSGLDFTLFGIPADEISDSYVLKVKGKTTLAIDEFLKSVPEFFGRFVMEKTINHRGYLDYSEELASMLRSMGYEQCEALKQI